MSATKKSKNPQKTATKAEPKLKKLHSGIKAGKNVDPCNNVAMR